MIAFLAANWLPLLGVWLALSVLVTMFLCAVINASHTLDHGTDDITDPDGAPEGSWYFHGEDR